MTWIFLWADYDCVRRAVPVVITDCAARFSTLGSFPRLRIGIGAPADNPEDRRAKTVSHVLGTFRQSEQDSVDAVLDGVLDSIARIQRLGLDRAGNWINSFRHPAEDDVASHHGPSARGSSCFQDQVLEGAVSAGGFGGPSTGPLTGGNCVWNLAGSRPD